MANFIPPAASANGANLGSYIIIVRQDCWHKPSYSEPFPNSSFGDIIFEILNYLLFQLELVVSIEQYN